MTPCRAYATHIRDSKKYKNAHTRYDRTPNKRNPPIPIPISIRCPDLKTIPSIHHFHLSHHYHIKIITLFHISLTGTSGYPRIVNISASYVLLAKLKAIVWAVCQDVGDF